ncbi:hypothetical protein BH09ACT2_BH09ACT2_03230 [soil metagenome]
MLGLRDDRFPDPDPGPDPASALDPASDPDPDSALGSTERGRATAAHSQRA